MSSAATVNLQLDPDSAVHNEHFDAWPVYDGHLATREDTDYRTGKTLVTDVYGWENITNPDRVVADLPDTGTSFGFVVTGSASLIQPADSDHVKELWRVTAGRFFVAPHGGTLNLQPDTRVVATTLRDYVGIPLVGGPIEARGRLRYIDRCSDTLLACPPLLGDPAYNHLHFPPGIEQTFHDHPSIRAGVIARGRGWCETPHGRSPLLPGLIFSIPAGGTHRFITPDDSTMDVIAYHPDSDWGPTDTEHPMINRTWVDGHKIDNSTGIHTQADVIGR